jgi:hypothetical protein
MIKHGTHTGSIPVLTTNIINMYYIDEKGRLIYESCGMKSEVIGFDYDGQFNIILLWE